MTRAGLAIFVKTPGYSPLKTRLAAERGRAYAENWYRRAAAAVAAVARVAAARHGLTAYWAVAEPAAMADQAWPDLPTIAQGEGDLGERMARVHAALVEAHGIGLLIGADTPQLSAALLGEALEALQGPEPTLALGAARDGGFWLFGGNVAPPMPTWQQVRYSTSDTARDFMRALSAYGAWRQLPVLTDVDRASDLDAALAELQRSPECLPEQRQLIAWMQAAQVSAA